MSPAHFHCQCGNGGAKWGCLHRFEFVQQLRDGSIEVKCLDCGSHSTSLHYDLRGKNPAGFKKPRTAAMLAADMLIFKDIAAWNQNHASPAPPIRPTPPPPPPPSTKPAKSTQMDLFD